MSYFGWSSLDFIIIPGSVQQIGQDAFTGTDDMFIVQCSFGGHDTIIINHIKLYDSDGTFLNAYGVAWMCVYGKNPSEYYQLINVSDYKRFWL